MKQRTDRPEPDTRIAATVYGYFGPVTGVVKWTGSTQGQLMTDEGVMLFFIYKDGWMYA